MPDLFDDLNKILKKDLIPILVKYVKDPNNKITDNLNNFFNDSRVSITNIFEQLYKNKDNNSNQKSYKDIENITDIDASFDDEYDEYDDLFKRLALIEENMIQIEKILQAKN